MTSNTAPKVGDTITTYEQLKQLPDGTVLAFNWSDRVRRFVQHVGNAVRLLNTKDGNLGHLASPEEPTLGGASYIVESIPEDDSDLESIFDSDLESIFDPEPESEPEPGWRVGQTVNTYEELRRLPEGTVITRFGLGNYHRRTIETRNGVPGLWDNMGLNLLPCLPNPHITGGVPKYTIVSLPTEASDPADELADFKRQVVEVATRFAEKHALCDVIDDALEELGLPIRNREHTVTMTVTMQIDLGRDSDPNEWDNERIAEHGRTVVEEALKNTGATVTDATTTPTAERSK